MILFEQVLFKAVSTSINNLNMIVAVELDCNTVK